MDKPNGSAAVVVAIIKEKPTDQLVEGIQHEKLNACVPGARNKRHAQPGWPAPG
jgi:hypothetical protein